MTEFINLRSKACKKSDVKDLTARKTRGGYRIISPKGLNEFETRHEQETVISDKKAQNSEMEVRRVFNFELCDQIDFLDNSSPNEEKNLSIHPKKPKKNKQKKKSISSFSNRRNNPTGRMNLCNISPISIRSIDTLSFSSCKSPMSSPSNRSLTSYSSKSSRKCRTNIGPSEFGAQTVKLCRSPGHLV
uniref:Uncharacterized protein n=1 Tax=Corethron hystrix TaxID=216773 RepID=A0A7S1FRM4_9STRA|mmetsp:Transcript_23299/g.53206  ORF Transcript_23299/g.53206 Transcript_23299/m.53206 type:complete len:188 (+) Transcript_23299:91-654(+)